MARNRAPQGRQSFRDDDDADTELNISSGDDDLEEEEEEGDDEDEDRGDDHEPTSNDDEDEDDDDLDDLDEEEDEEDDDDLDEETLRAIGNSDTVPRARLNEVLEENRRLREAQANGGGGGGQPEQQPAFDLKAKTKERNEKLLEGDIDGASAIDDEIAEYHADRASHSAVAAAQQVILQERVNETIAEIQRKYPVLNDKKRDVFDRDTLDEVVALRNVYIGRGDRMDVALRKAAKRICGRGEREDSGGSGEDRRRAPAQSRNEMTLRQKKEAMRRARQSPPALGRNGTSGRPAGSAVGLSEDAIARMPESKFRAMTPREKAEARGDFVSSGKSRRR